MTISLYLGQEYLFSFFVAFLFFFFIFFLNHLLLLAEDILSKNVPFFKVVLIIIYSLPAIIAFSFPFASLVGGLMAIGRFSSDNEILSMQASGISHSKLFVPFVILGILFSMVSFVMNDYFLPLGTINFSRMFREILYSNPELELESNTIKRYQDSIIIPGRVEGKVIEDLVIIDKTPEKE
jgi:lipopolysaccharide export system permease protein